MSGAPVDEKFGAWPRSRVSAQIKAIKKRELALVAPPEEEHLPLEALTSEGAADLWENWFRSHGYSPFSFQRKAWGEYLRGRSGVISVPTGSGKTLAVMGGAVLSLLQKGRAEKEKSRINVLYIAPLKALARDVSLAIEKPFLELGLPFTVGVRTGDTDNVERAKIKKALPHVLVTTPESLALMTAERDWRSRFQSLEAIVIDEWHEILGTKRGSLLELTLARLRDGVPSARTWVLSATLGNLEEAGEVAIGNRNFALIKDSIARETEVKAILPRESLPWFGSAAIRLRAELFSELNPAESTIIFTNTRSQAELWHQTILFHHPDWENSLALHHGSLEKEERRRVEQGVKEGHIRIVVATSSLDLGVDFPHVKKVIQVGSVKTVTRALQRSGRAEHTFGKKSRFFLLPTSLFDLVETSAVREALRAGKLEGRSALPKPIDVLVQFLLNSAFNEGFTREEAERWISAAPSFRPVTNEELDWAFQFVTTGGKTLGAYPDFRKLVLEDGRYKFSHPRIARLHRFNIGTILDSSGMQVQFLGGKKLGFIDEAFVAKMKRGDVFQFSGRALQIVQVRDMVAYVRLAKSKRVIPAVWNGQVLPVSPVIAKLIREEWTKPSKGSEAEREAIAGLLAIQAERSHVPAADEVLIERWRTRAGHHLFLFLFEGRLVHEGLGHILAYRLGKLKPNTISVSANDQGLELLSTEALGSQEEIIALLRDANNLEKDIEGSFNFPELVKRTFREIARVAGLVQQSSPGKQKSTRQLQMSTSLLYEVFAAGDPDNLLLAEARAQARREQLDFPRLKQAVERIKNSRIQFCEIKELTPFSLPLHVERIRSQVSTEELVHRVERLQRELFGGSIGN